LFCKFPKSFLLSTDKLKGSFVVLLTFVFTLSSISLILVPNGSNFVCLLTTLLLLAVSLRISPSLFGTVLKGSGSSSQENLSSSLNPWWSLKGSSLANGSASAPDSAKGSSVPDPAKGSSAPNSAVDPNPSSEAKVAEPKASCCGQGEEPPLAGATAARAAAVKGGEAKGSAVVKAGCGVVAQLLLLSPPLGPQGEGELPPCPPQGEGEEPPCPPHGEVEPLVLGATLEH